MLAFHRDALPRIAAAGFPRLTVAAVRGRPVAAYYRLSWRDRATAYLSGFDPAFARQSPLTVLIGEGFRAAQREGVRESGSELPSGLLHEFGRVLASSGNLLILNYAYRGDLELDRRELSGLGAAAGLSLRSADERPFAPGDGAIFHLAKPS